MICELIKKVRLSADTYDYTVFCPEMAEKTKAGQFLHILCGGGSYLRRPISVCDVLDKKWIRFIFEVRGEGTEELAKRKEGEMLDILGPLGNGFGLEDIPAEGAVLLVGGGIGIFPLLRLAKDLGGRATALLGFRNKESILLADEFAACSKNVFIATDDGSCGFHGYVTDILKNIMQNNKIAKIYTCGPKPMMKIVAGIAGEKGILTEVSMEERMGCGVGACVTCTCTVAGSRKRVCKDGPIFNGLEVEWDG